MCVPPSSQHPATKPLHKKATAIGMTACMYMCEMDILTLRASHPLQNYVHVAVPHASAVAVNSIEGHWVHVHPALATHVHHLQQKTQCSIRSCDCIAAPVLQTALYISCTFIASLDIHCRLTRWAPLGGREWYAVGLP